MPRSKPLPEHDRHFRCLSQVPWVSKAEHLKNGQKQDSASALGHKKANSVIFHITFQTYLDNMNIRNTLIELNSLSYFTSFITILQSSWEIWFDLNER